MFDLLTIDYNLYIIPIDKYFCDFEGFCYERFDSEWVNIDTSKRVTQKIKTFDQSVTIYPIFKLRYHYSHEDEVSFIAFSSQLFIDGKHIKVNHSPKKKPIAQSTSYKITNAECSFFPLAALFPVSYLALLLSKEPSWIQ